MLALLQFLENKIPCSHIDLFIIIVLYIKCPCFGNLNYFNISCAYKRLFEYLCIHYASIVFLQEF